MLTIRIAGAIIVASMAAGSASAQIDYTKGNAKNLGGSFAPGKLSRYGTDEDDKSRIGNTGYGGSSFSSTKYVPYVRPYSYSTSNYSYHAPTSSTRTRGGFGRALIAIPMAIIAAIAWVFRQIGALFGLTGSHKASSSEDDVWRRE